MENKFYSIMNKHSDEELLAVYKKQAEYTPEAVAAMEFILRERNLIQQASEQLAEVKQAEEASAEEIYNKFQRSEFGKVVSNAAFAKDNLNDSMYFQGYISPMHNYTWVNHLFIIFGIIGLTLSIVFLAMEDLRRETNLLLTTSLLFAALLPVGVWRLSKSKTKLTISKRMRSNLVVIKGPKDDFEIQLPLHYECFWEWKPIRYSLKQVQLNIFLFNDKMDYMIALSELLEAQKAPAPFWDHRPEDKELKYLIGNKKVYHFQRHGFQKPFLYRFEKILSGLHVEGDDRD